MSSFATPAILMGFALLALPGTVKLARRGRIREVLTCVILMVIALVPAFCLIAGIELPRITTTIDRLLSQLLSPELVQDMGFRLP